MKNKLSDLNNHLFEQLERLNDNELSGEQLAAEIERAKAMSGIATQIVNGTKVVVDAMKLVHRGDAPSVINKLLGEGLS
ncbi:hypothetical protein ABDK00_017020 [Niabella insulamsoli]|uniref:hypothetical protein n=1 Tax=Niabella insulamsoli TaxID=3144874 RepID=UPI0031FE0EF7